MNNHQLMVHDMPMTNVQEQQYERNDIDEYKYTDHNPAFVKFNKSREKESLFRKMSFKTVHSVTRKCLFLISQLYLKLPV